MTRSSHIVYAVARFRANDRVVWLLRRHPKWGDWSLVGGHVEEDEREDRHQPLGAHARMLLALLLRLLLSLWRGKPRRWPQRSRSAQI